MKYFKKSLLYYQQGSKSLSCIFRAILIPKAAIVSKKIFFTFSHTNAHVTKFDLGVEWVKVNLGS